ncbi:NADPH-dependent F420 reductase [Limibacillus sp. MBR-115]|uniref:NADPH-dependent F420 reductase n=1 Tax=Limibacillus sp. MBR-115 TaxID=3156465 RepID=UPI003399FE4A
MSSNKPSVAVIGGTGALGGGIAYRLTLAGYRVILGSRDAARAAEASQALNARVGGDMAVGASNRDAAGKCEVVILAVPFSTHEEILTDIAGQLEGKVVVDTTVPLVPPKVSTVQVTQTGSPAARTAEVLGDKAQVVSAMQNVAADKLASGEDVACDVLVTGNNGDAKATVMTLITDMGMRGIDAGPLANSIAAEALTSILIGLNRRYKVKGAGIQITGLETAS